MSGGRKRPLPMYVKIGVTVPTSENLRDVCRQAHTSRLVITTGLLGTSLPGVMTGRRVRSEVGSVSDL